ncbi:related to cytochrome P450 phenylacetate hydroxylase [Rhynchosporium secalis]|uniref:Related to cytochrome P450 phenylacetate hydroxylase n=1 Tax=Rhynchosporium secalis TaxID=38038 RepID=A0A1E1MFS1_RHYSE|nr:related to cytochrome P450 phenylacetate hydroxylase [Rhynchosporium secalis]
MSPFLPPPHFVDCSHHFDEIGKQPPKWAILDIINTTQARLLSGPIQSLAFLARIPGLDGPIGLPLIGNLWQIRENAAEKYQQWSRTHGAMYQIQLGNIPIVVVLSNSASTTIGKSPCSDSLKRRRKGAASALNRASNQTCIPHLDLESKDFVAELLRYGKSGDVEIRMDSQDDALFDEIPYVEDEISRFRSTTGNLQDYVPLVRLNPFGFGSKKAAEMRDRRDEGKLNTEELTSVSLAMLSGGLDTVTTLLQWSIVLLSQPLDVQEKAWKDISHFYSDEQPLCDPLGDQKCKYIAALVRECLRYFTVLRLAPPHASIKDVTYEGVVSKGTVYFINAFACNRDEAIWSDSEEFCPERWLEVPDAPMFTSGIGYRMCAASMLANRELYLVFIRMMNSLENQKFDDVDAHPVSGNSDPTSLVAMPHKYKARFVPSNSSALEKGFRVVDEPL